MSDTRPSSPFPIHLDQLRMLREDPFRDLEPLPLLVYDMESYLERIPIVRHPATKLPIEHVHK